MDAWTKVDPAAWRRALAILAAADPDDKEAVKAATVAANRECGIELRKRAQKPKPLEG